MTYIPSLLCFGTKGASPVVPGIVDACEVLFASQSLLVGL